MGPFDAGLLVQPPFPAGPPQWSFVIVGATSSGVLDNGITEGAALLLIDCAAGSAGAFTGTMRFGASDPGAAVATDKVQATLEVRTAPGSWACFLITPASRFMRVYPGALAGVTMRGWVYKL